jgi:hypothetical protein
MVGDEYKSKLDQFFALVPKTPTATRINKLTGVEFYGEVLSGSPIIAFKKGEREAAKQAVEAASISDNANFTTLTGLTHRKLLNNWKDGGLLTSCNAFVMKAGQAVGVRGLGGFNVEETMIGLSKRHCWITPMSGEKPQYGDVFESRSRTPGNDYENLHVGISLSVEGDDWYTIEGGQGGPGSGVDRVARVKRKYDTKHLLGWVDMRLLASGQGPLPDWLIGNWMIYAGNQNYVYSFNRYGEVTQKAYRPPAGSAGNVPDVDTGKVSVSGDTATVTWGREGGQETFTYDRMNSFSGLNERMKGVAADGSAMQGVRL